MMNERKNTTACSSEYLVCQDHRAMWAVSIFCMFTEYLTLM